MLAALAARYAWHPAGAESGNATPGPPPTLPDRIGEWTGQAVATDPVIRDVLEADEILQKDYRSSRGTVTATAVVARNWRAVHSPLGCFPSGGWTIVQRRRRALPVPAGQHLSSLPVQEVTATKGDHTVVAMWTFICPDAVTDNWVRQCWNMARAGRGRRGLLLLLQTEQDAAGRPHERLAELAVLLCDPLMEALRVY
ncbi:MAG: exosortase C-terminal domain/associated protein EpsI [Armatimonadota bacterium]